MKEIKLTLWERFTLLNILPQQDSYENMIRVKSITEKIQLSSNEVDKYKIEQTDKGFSWAIDQKDNSFPTKFESGEIKLINVQFQLQIKKSRKTKNISLDFINLVQKFKT